MANRSKEQRWTLAGATALVTGGSKGIGRAIVEELAGFGATVHTCARNEVELRNCMEEWKKMNMWVTISACDVSVRAQREQLMGRVRAMFDGKLNILVNNAAIGQNKPTLEVTAEEFSDVMITNFESCFHLSQLSHPLLKASGRGNILHISSIGAFIGYPAVGIYGATKVYRGDKLLRSRDPANSTSPGR